MNFKVYTPPISNQIHYTMQIFSNMNVIYHHVPPFFWQSDRYDDEPLGVSSGPSSPVGRNVLNREVAKDGDTVNMPRPAAVEAESGRIDMD